MVSQYGQRILFVGAHPDDIEIGCGGSASKLMSEGHTIAFAVATFSPNKGAEREREAKEAASMLGLSESNGTLFFARIEEGKLLDTMGDLREWLKKVSTEFKPDTVFIHRSDGHSDHQAVNKVASGCFLKQGVYEYYIPRTEPEPGFTPTHFIEITDHIDRKVEMCNCHKTQPLKYIDEHIVRTTAEFYYQRCDALQGDSLQGFVEPFITVRSFTHEVPAASEPLGPPAPNTAKRVAVAADRTVEDSRGEVIELLVTASRVLKKLGARQFVGDVRRRAALSYLTFLHEDVTHEMRKFALACEHCGPSWEWNENSWEVLGPAAESFCTACRKIFCCLAELEANQIHCCLKAINADSQTVETWARSGPVDSRDEEIIHPIDKNTVWAALLGRSDGNQTWSLFNCFSSKDLSRYQNIYKNTRPKWQKHYKSVLIFPLRYMNKRGSTHFDTFGFLALDSKKVDAFRGMPEIFEHVNDRDVYNDMARKSVMFQTGAAIADTLSMFLRPICTGEPQNK